VRELIHDVNHQYLYTYNFDMGKTRVNDEISIENLKREKGGGITKCLHEFQSYGQSIKVDYIEC